MKQERKTGVKAFQRTVGHSNKKLGSPMQAKRERTARDSTLLNQRKPGKLHNI